MKVFVNAAPKLFVTRDGDKMMMIGVLESGDDDKIKSTAFVVKIHRQKRGTPWSKWFND